MSYNQDWGTSSNIINSEMCIMPLSKCTNLRHLDLFLTRAPINPLLIRRAVSRLQKLKSLRLPFNNTLGLHSEEGTTWPPQLEKLGVAGILPQPLSSDIWPTRLSSLTLDRCVNLSVGPLFDVLHSLVPFNRLRRLRITGSNGDIDPSGIASILPHLRSLTFLSVPGPLINGPFFEEVISRTQLFPLKTLEFGYCASERLDLPMETFVVALKGPLDNIRQIGFHDAFCDEKRITDDAELEDVLNANADFKAKAKSEAGGFKTFEGNRRDLEPGVYYFDGRV